MTGTSRWGRWTQRMNSQQEMRQNWSTLKSWKGPRWTTLGCMFGDPKGILRGNVMIAMTVQVVPWMSRPRHTLSPLNFCYPTRNVHLSRSPQAHSNVPKEIHRVREFQPKHFMLHQTFKALNNHIQRNTENSNSKIISKLTLEHISTAHSTPNF